MKPLYPDDYWKVTINWSRPSLYKTIIEQGHDLDEKAYLYIILGKYSSNNPKIFYIGRTFKQDVSTRLNQKDHKKRYASILEDNKRHKLLVSYGSVDIDDGKNTKNRISELEKILIYSNKPEHAYNVKNYYNHGVKGSYEITNNGYKCTLPSKICLGVFIK